MRAYAASIGNSSDMLDLVFSFPKFARCAHPIPFSTRNSDLPTRYGTATTTMASIMDKLSCLIVKKSRWKPEFGTLKTIGYRNK